MDKFFYQLFIRLYPIAAKLISPFNAKAKQWIEGQENIFENITTQLKIDETNKIWVHCASLGEFEQGKPVIENLKTLYADYKIVLTFFSPSGYEPLKNNKLADYIFYLPIDSEKNAPAFIEIVKPALAVFIKYEYWYYYLKQLHQQSIPVLLVSGIFLPEYSFFKWYGKMRREMLQFFSHFFVQNDSSKKLLRAININNVSVTGDTRFDRVLEIAAEIKSFPEIEQFAGNALLVVAGSTWFSDDEALDHFVNTHPEIKFIIAPHDIGKERLKECCHLYKHSLLFSEFVQALQHKKIIDKKINALIIDNIGMLKYLYRYATICYVGGGFGSTGIHNILEAAVYYKPVLFGPAFDKFLEAVQLVEKGGAFDVEDALELECQLEELISDKKLYDEAAAVCGNYVKENSGATNLIMQYIQANRLLTS